MTQQDLDYWEEVARRYFQAETTEEEERQLRRFLCTPAAQDGRFDAVRATVSFLHAGRRPRLRIRRAVQAAAIAACLCAACFVGWHQYRQGHGTSSVRIGGEVARADASQVMQRQMNEMFSTLQE